ncbi:hypothetical protein C8T65DRAFT_658921, partial [Cerioporus squamosus]
MGKGLYSVYVSNSNFSRSLTCAGHPGLVITSELATYSPADRLRASPGPVDAGWTLAPATHRPCDRRSAVQQTD